MFMQRLSFSLAVALGLVLGVCSTPRPVGAQTTDVLAGLRPQHPRLIVTAADWTQLSQLNATSEPRQLSTKIEAQARGDLNLQPVVYNKVGKRLWNVSREAFRRILLWSAAYHLTGDKAFAQRAEKEMLTVVQFEDWNPSHFLDTAEMTAGCAFGYDWLYDQLSEQSRAIIRKAIVEKGLNAGLKFNDWQKREDNWNQVCFCGMTLGALAIADEEPQLARQMLEIARRDNFNGMRPYAPDGIYPEGPNYWDYGTSYEVLLISALQSALGTDWGLSDSPGFMQSWKAQVVLSDPNGVPYSFSDGPGGGGGLEPAAFWFAQRLHQPELLWFQQRYLDRALASNAGGGRGGGVSRNHLIPLLPFWLEDKPATNPAPNLPLNWHGGGINPVGVFHTSWTNANGIFLGFKGGSGLSSGHAHLDAGSFVLYAAGVTWAVDLGWQDYNSLESKGVDLWNPAQNGGRWTVFRLNNFSHNTLTIDNQLHRAAAHANITEFKDGPQPQATVDLSDTFAGQATRVIRRFELGSASAVFIRDELAGVTPGKDVRWAMVTRAQVELNGAAATLGQNGKTLQAKILSPAGASFTVIPADPPVDNFNAPNPNTRILVIHIATPADGKLDIAVELDCPDAS
jgi:hypothetical protein